MNQEIMKKKPSYLTSCMPSDPASITCFFHLLLLQKTNQEYAIIFVLCDYLPVALKSVCMLNRTGDMMFRVTQHPLTR